MLRWVASGSGPRLAGFIHHTDSEREPGSPSDRRDLPYGKWNHVLAEARARSWIIVDTHEDWNTIFPQKTS
ncbi:MAG: hypothetical protein WC586_02970 [Methanoregula sp.]